MSTDPPRYAEIPETQADLSNRHAELGRDHRRCYRRTCSVCGKVFYAGLPHASLCSERCNQNAVLARRKALRRQHRTRRCPRCGNIYMARRKDGVYCSNACRQAVHRQRHSA